MGDGQQRGSGAQGGKMTSGAAVELELRRTAATDHFDIAPEDLLRVTGAERLHRGFLGGKSSRKMDRRLPPSHAISNLAVGEHALQETVAKSFDRRGDPRDVGGIEPQTDDLRH